MLCLGVGYGDEKNKSEDITGKQKRKLEPKSDGEKWGCVFYAVSLKDAISTIRK